MVHEELSTMAHFKLTVRSGMIAGVAVLLMLAGCAKDPNAPATGGSLSLGLAGGGGAGAAVPGSAQDFVSNIGDRVFFDTDSDRPQHPGEGNPRLHRLSGSGNTPRSLSRSKVTPTSAAPASTTSRWAPAGPKTSRNTWSRAVSPHRGSRPFPMARSGPSRPATPRAAGRKTGAPSRFWRAPALSRPTP